MASIVSKLPGNQISDAANNARNDEEVEKRANQVLCWLATEGNSR
jgi:hypothetical protein